LKINEPFFFGCQTYVDYEMGRVLNAIDTYAPNALVIYTADHGDALSSHSLEGKGPAMYEEIARIPLVVRCPGLVTAGGVCSHPVSHINLVPTILDTMGYEAPKWLQGTSLIATLKNPDVRPNDAVFIEFSRFEVDHDGYGGFRPIRCVMDGRHKLVINLLDSDELYDLQKDPDELVNLIGSAEYAEVRNQLHDRLMQWINDSRDPFRGYGWECRHWRSDRVARWDWTEKTRQREEDGYEPRCIDYDTGLEMVTSVRKME
jgi:arylsulfatase A-like enzyme